MSEGRTAEGEATARAHVERTVASPVAPGFRVLVIEGKDRGGELTVGAASPAPLLVGTGPACDLVLTDARVSRRHLALAPDAAGLRLVDLGSTNGTLVGSLRVKDALLGGGELVRVGESTLRVERRDDGARVPLWPVESFGRLLGASVAMRRLYPLFQKLAASAIPAIIEGETGTGKELLAESLHEMGPRKNHPFVVFDASAHEGRSAEVLLFGEERAAAGGAANVRRGAFEEADGGTLLVDEVTELPLGLQAKLVRALERGEICRVGGDRWIKVDARVLATSRRNVDREVELGRFREDLFFRIATARAPLPPLRHREGDAALLAPAFWKTMAGERPYPPELLAAYEGYGWPGNVRELENVVARKVALGEVLADDAGPAAPQPVALDASAFERVLGMNLSFPEAKARVVADFERYFIERVLARHGGNVSRAAAASGIARRYFQILRTRSR